MEIREVLKSQYLAALELLRRHGAARAYPASPAQSRTAMMAYRAPALSFSQLPVPDDEPKAGC